MNPVIDWKKGILDWRKPETETNLLKKAKQSRTPVTITEEEDKEEYLNSTQNPLDDHELSVLIASITGDTDGEAWINSKSTMATLIQAEINAKKKILPIDE